MDTKSMTRKEFVTLTFTLLGSAAAACSSSSSSNDGGTGGSFGSGGTNGTGGVQGTGGANGTGGTSGATGTGGTSFDHHAQRRGDVRLQDAGAGRSDEHQERPLAVELD